MSLERSSETLYHALPQVSSSSLLTVTPSDVELDETPAVDPPPVLIDSRIRWIHFILGCSVLLPWNALITATPFFLSRLTHSAYRHTFPSYLSITFMISNFVFLGHATAVSKQSRPSRQTRMTIRGLAFLTLLLTISTFFDVAPGLFFAFVILNGIFQAALGSYLMTSVVAVASLFGPIALQAMMSGQAAVAVAVSGVQVASSALFLAGGTPDSIAANAISGSAEERAALLFFALSTAFLGLSALANDWLVSMPTYKTLIAPLEGKEGAETGSIEERQALTSLGRTSNSEEKARILRVAKSNVLYEVAVAYVFVVTLAVYPPITTLVQPTNPKFHPLLFSGVHFLVFNLGDFLGRYVCSIPSLLIWSARRLLVLSVARTLFIPLFLACNIRLPSMPSEFPSSPLISSDFLFFLILFLFGATNGYVSSLCLMSAPSLEHNPRLRGRREDVDVAATVATFCIVGGLVLGSMGSFAVRAMICGCNPFRN